MLERPSGRPATQPPGHAATGPPATQCANVVPRGCALSRHGTTTTQCPTTAVQPPIDATPQTSRCQSYRNTVPEPPATTLPHHAPRHRPPATSLCTRSAGEHCMAHDPSHADDITRQLRLVPPHQKSMPQTPWMPSDHHECTARQHSAGTLPPLQGRAADLLLRCLAQDLHENIARERPVAVLPLYCKAKPSSCRTNVMQC
eukprot:NODE_878_length_1329_cov_297.547881.p2 GENE.NODE_878_length_1329_cov_297.547881~~NODE_878_length_1329_cov_297.547881.p2  ORF type:complete len:201 (-),score=0.05 NODE_878_length_1329_cov_297.547881:183-785(-)